MKSLLMIWAVAAGVALSSLPAHSRPAPPAQKGQKPLIILFSFDTLRADHLSCYGYDRRTSPFIDEMAKDSVLFSNPISQSPLTAPAHASIFTALTPAVHLVNNPNDTDPDIYNTLSPEVPTLASVLKAAGYLTVGMHGGGCVSSDFGFDRGFDYYGGDFFFNFQTVYYRPERELQSIRKWLKESRDQGKPLFLFLHHFLCHHPYLQCPAEFELRFLPKPVPGLPIDRSGLLKNEDPGWGIWDENSVWRDVDLNRPDHNNHIVSLYDGSIAYADTIFRDLLNILKEEGFYENSFIILTGDHGEEFNEHGGKMHGRLFIEHLYVPLIIKFPGNRYAGQKIPDLVRTMDILPSICDYLNISSPPRIQGVSMLPLLHGKGRYDPLISSYALTYQGPHSREMDVSERLARGDWAYSNLEWNGQTEWLFNTTRDPGEQSNLARAEKEILKEMRSQAELLKAENQNFRKSFAPGEGSAPPLGDKVKKQLRSLGYIQ
ncbi:MAG: sulfatase [PVC group bacterium]